MSKLTNKSPHFDIIGLNYVTIYVKDLEAAIVFYSQVLGPPDVIEDQHAIHGWKMGTTWLTLFPSKIGTHKDSNPRNAEFAIQLGQPEEVDRLYAALIEAGAKECMAPHDGEMYDTMRFGCVDDPFGMRIDVYCPINSTASEEAS